MDKGPSRRRIPVPPSPTQDSSRKQEVHMSHLPSSKAAKKKFENMINKAVPQNVRESVMA